MQENNSGGGKPAPSSRKRKRRPPYRPLALSLVATIGLLWYGAVHVEHITQTLLVDKLLWPLSRLLLFILVGLVFGQLIESSGYTRQLAVLARPMFRYGNLGNRCSAAFTTAFFSGVAANAMLLGYYKDEQISRRQLYLANFINQLPAFFLHLPTTFFIVFPLTGRAGLIYFALTLAATLLRTGLFVLYGHFFMAAARDSAHIPQQNVRQKTKQPFGEALKKKLPARIMTIVVWVLPIYTAVFLLNQTGMFDRANHYISSIFTTGFMPVEALSVVVLSFAAEFTSGFAAAGAMLNSGVITVQQTVIALIAGNILAFPLRALRHQLPRYIGIFSPKMGTEILLYGQCFRILSLILVTTLYYFIF